MDPLLKDFPIVHRQEVQWGEMDSLGHVNNAVYFRYMESARMAYLEQLGLGGDLSDHREAPILANINCDFLLPLVYPDHVNTGISVHRIGNSSFRMKYAMVSDKLGLVARADSVIVMFDYDKQSKVVVSEALRKRIAEIEGT